MRSLQVFILCFGAGLGCASGPQAPVTHSDAANELRAQRALADNDFERALINEELAPVELERAREANTVFAYRRFLAEFSIGREATTARRLLEELRFKEASQLDTRLAWESFLDEHPHGAHAAEARMRLGAIAIEGALKSEDLLVVREVLSRFPDHARRGELLAHEDELSFSLARTEGLDSVQRYLREHPLGVHRVEALDLRDALEKESILASGDLQRARQVAKADPSGASKSLVDELLLRSALEELDLGALEQLSREASTEVAARATEHLAAFRRRPLPTAAARAHPSHGLRTPVELRTLLNSADPLERVAALGEAAEYGSWASAALALDSVENRYVDVRLAAVETLRALKTAMTPEAWRAFVDGREKEALVDALTATPWRRVAALRDADGRLEGALRAWGEVIRYDPDDLAARARVLELSKSVGDRLAVGAAARELASTAALFGDGRWLEPNDPNAPAVERRDGPGATVGVPAAVTVLRQLCAAMSLTRLGRDSLDALRSGAQASELQLYTLALNDSDRAIGRMALRRAELERDASKRGFAPCDSKPLEPTLAKAHAERLEAMEELARQPDPRLLPFAERLRRSPSAEIRSAAEALVGRLSAALE